MQEKELGLSETPGAGQEEQVKKGRNYTQPSRGQPDPPPLSAGSLWFAPPSQFQPTNTPVSPALLSFFPAVPHLK